MAEILSWLFFLVFIAALIVVGGLLLRGYLATGSVTGSINNTFFAPRPVKRLEVVDHASVDGRRRLVLVRRDNVEHLIMIGGPVDVVVETGIAADGRAVVAAATKPVGEVVGAPVFARAARAFGQAAMSQTSVSQTSVSPSSGGQPAAVQANVAEKQAVGEK